MINYWNFRKCGKVGDPLNACYCSDSVTTFGHRNINEISPDMSFYKNILICLELLKTLV